MKYRKWIEGYMSERSFDQIQLVYRISDIESGDFSVRVQVYAHEQGDPWPGELRRIVNTEDIVEVLGPVIENHVPVKYTETGTTDSKPFMWPVEDLLPVKKKTLYRIHGGWSYYAYTREEALNRLAEDLYEVDHEYPSDEYPG